MTKPDPQTCEVKIGETWQCVSLAEAGGVHNTRPKRCPACHGPVAVSGTYGGPTVRRVLSHRKSHDGCPLMPSIYTGEPSPHPQALR